MSQPSSFDTYQPSFKRYDDRYDYTAGSSAERRDIVRRDDDRRFSQGEGVRSNPEHRSSQIAHSVLEPREDRKRAREEDRSFETRRFDDEQKRPAKFERKFDEKTQKDTKVPAQFKRSLYPASSISRPSSFSIGRNYGRDRKRGDRRRDDRGRGSSSQRFSTHRGWFSNRGQGSTITTIPIKGPYFEMIQSGKKTIEGRINKSFFQYLKTGQEVVFFTTQRGRKLEVTCQIKDIRYYPDFRSMLQGEEDRETGGCQKVLPGTQSIEEGACLYESIPGYMEQLRTYRFPDPNKKVMAIEIELKR